MVDTIIIRINDLHEHFEFRQYLEEMKDGKSVGFIEKSPEDFKIDQEMIRLKMLKDHSNGNWIQLRKWNKKHTQSSHYDLAYSIDTIKDCIDFNFSIPKYIYGHNIAQFIDNHNKKDFVFAKNMTWEHNAADLYRRLVNFITHFFQKEFYPDIIINTTKLEIVRLDLCYNQIFASKEDALEYIAYQKNIKKNYSRITSNLSRAWHTSLVYKAEGNSFKIYHKGTEYEKHDRKQHLKINKAFNKKVFDIDKLQDFADRILRYEVSFNFNYFSYVFKNHIWRKNCETTQALKARYKKLRGMERAGRLTEASSEHRKFYYTFSKVLQKNHRFFLEVESKTEIMHKYHHDPYDFHVKEARFSPLLLKYLIKKFQDSIKEYQLFETPALSHNLKVIRDYNNEVKIFNELNRFDIEIGSVKKRIGLNENMYRNILEKLSDETFERLKGGYPPRTWYRIQKNLKELGITKQAVKYMNIVVKTDFEDYINEVIYSYPEVIKYS